ncbi:MAG TPA: 4Fe-4S dicluster domain-containing protein [Bacteroidia bacterium]|nr:4Fe-4S dicluster domain-containing protein [Sphingobacteriales bacterium]HPD64373.1 4Fe-4S dicluster domain-containing protein [Bacteroidia bacterium]HRU66969.1 4Fe-4S dicluster domain-containing protein [Bacteroidia bacterium]
MGNNNDSGNDKSRRNFLKNFGLTVGVGALAAGGSLYVANQVQKKKGKKVKVLTQDGQLAEVEATELSLTPKEELERNQKRGFEGLKGRKWVMVIDLAKCRNARMCIAACQTAHHLRPEQYHINTLIMQDSKDTKPYFMPKPCYHCDNPPCTKVCPVNATWKRSDGIVLIDNERCIGCRFCMAACPYSARVFHWFEPLKVEGDEDRVYDVELNVPQKKGTITKCLFSADRLRQGKLPYCVSACPNGVYWFGDKNEDAVTNGTTGETVSFSELIRENAGYTVHEELGTKPQVFYLPAKNRLFPFQHEGKTELEDTEHI